MLTRTMASQQEDGTVKTDGHSRQKDSRKDIAKERAFLSFGGGEPVNTRHLRMYLTCKLCRIAKYDRFCGVPVRAVPHCALPDEVRDSQCGTWRRLGREDAARNASHETDLPISWAGARDLLAPGGVEHGRCRHQGQRLGIGRINASHVESILRTFSLHPNPESPQTRKFVLSAGPNDEAFARVSLGRNCAPTRKTSRRARPKSK